MRESKRLKWTRKFNEVFANYRIENACPETVIISMAPDRQVIRSSPEWIKWFGENCRPWDMGIKKHRPPGIVDPVALSGCRDKENWAAAQFIEFSSDHQGRVIEVDFDLANPGAGMFPGLAHGIEYLRYRVPKVWGGDKAVTNPFIVERWMKWRDQYGL